eukprot:scaffold39106_cov67-Phaeocystis_antarctica.AAC.2
MRARAPGVHRNRRRAPCSRGPQGRSRAAAGGAWHIHMPYTQSNNAPPGRREVKVSRSPPLDAGRGAAFACHWWCVSGVRIGADGCSITASRVTRRVWPHLGRRAFGFSP